MEKWVIGNDTPDSIVDYIVGLDEDFSRKPIICFDYFDTLVVRDIEPEYTKVIASAALSRLLNHCFSGSDLYRFRRDLERELTLRNADINNELDFCLDDFAHRFWSYLKGLDPQVERIRQDEFVRILLAIEVAVERAVQKVCPDAVIVLEKLKNRDFPLVLVSDFYLPEQQFHEMLSGCALDSFFSKVYVSSAQGKGKGSGRLYLKIAEEFQCTPQQMIMIGDNMHADITMARQCGIKTIHVQRPAQKKMYELFRQEKRDVHPEPSAFYHDFKFPVGNFLEMGCSLWLFTHRLFQELHRKDVKDVFFLSKEGEFLKKLFDLYQMKVFGQLQIRSHYLLASRKATFIASLCPLEQEDFLRLFLHYRDISIRDFLQSLNFENESIEYLCRQLSADCNQRFQNLRFRQEFSELLSLQAFREEFEMRRQQQRSNFIRYLGSFGINLSEGLHVVDVGWKGSIQDNIFHILAGKVQLAGYYIGSFNATERQENNQKKGVLFDNYQKYSPFFHVYNNNRSLFEMMLGATHGSADCYLLTSEYEKDTAHSHLLIHSTIQTDNGRLVVMVLDLPEERKLFEDTIRPLQDSLLTIFSDLTARFLHAACESPSMEWFARRHARMVFTPTKKEVDFFATLYHLENFGIFEYTNFNVAGKLTIRERLRNLINVMKDRSVLESGIWPPVILRRLGLNFIQPLEGRHRYYREFVQGKG
jgi:HAD superfamily hydrolase (TIGR01549 family)